MTGHQRKRSIFPKHEGEGISARSSGFDRGALSLLVKVAGTSPKWGWLPGIAVLQSTALLLLAVAFAGARADVPLSDFLFWISLALLIFPAAFRLASAEPARRERIGLILLLGMSLYFVKVMYSPVAFTFPDELSHMRNVNEILETHRLFQENPVQPVTAFYPGLPTVTSTLVTLSGLPVFPAGLLVIGIARLILFLALFLLFEQISGSPQVAGLAVLLYMANPNALYWTSEYAYEALALPLATLVLLGVAKRETATDGRHRMAWTTVALLGLLTVAITHHMTSYFLTGVLLALTIFSAVRSRGTQWGPWSLALIAVIVNSLWLLFFANPTIKYLSFIFWDATRSALNLIGAQGQLRELFESASTGQGAPPWEQIVGAGSVLLIAAGLPFGAFEVGKRYGHKLFALLLAGIAGIYLPMLFLRFTQAGWEIANRSSEFLFIGVGFVLAAGIVNFWFSKWPKRNNLTVFALLAVFLFFGGLIIGWPPQARLPRPYVVSADNGYLVRPQVVTAAEWMETHLGQDHHLAASKADAKVFGAYGQYPFTGSAGAIQDMLFSAGVGPSERGILSKRNIEYIVADRKQVSWDHMIGYYFFNQESDPAWELKSVDPRIFGKFDRLPGVTRVLDTGDIVVYDIQRYLAATRAQAKPAGTGAISGSIQHMLRTGNMDLASSGDGSGLLLSHGSGLNNKPGQNHPANPVPASGWPAMVSDNSQMAGLGVLLIPLSALLVLFLPGFLATVILFPGKSLGIVERLLLGAGLSVALTALGGLALSLAQVRLDSTTLWITLLAGIAAEIAVVHLTRRAEWREVYRVPADIGLSRSQWVFMAGATLTLVAAILMARTPVPQNGLEGYTMLWVHAAGGSGSVALGVKNEEFAETGYQIKYESDGILRAGPTLRLKPGETWEQVVSLPVDETAGKPFNILLYRLDSPAEVYRRAVWWFESAQGTDFNQ